MMKETYETLELEIVKFAGDDMIMMSSNDNDGWEDSWGDGSEEI